MVTEAISIMRQLWTGEFVDFHGQFYDLKAASLYMKASVPIYIAAVGPKMAKVVGRLGDGFICNPPTTMEYVKSVLFPAMAEGARQAGRSYEDIYKVYELDVSYAKDRNQALSSLKHVVAPLSIEGYVEPISDPRQLEAMSGEISESKIERSYVIGTTAEDHIKKIQEAFEAGFDHVCILSFSPNEEECIDMYKKQILPHFADR